MPKRPNPFGEIAPIQLKTHVGVKEVNQGSRQDELMRIVYEKTQEKLFSGAQRRNDINDNSVQASALSVQSPLELAIRFEPRQALLDSNGCLISPIPASSPAGIQEHGEETSMVCEMDSHNAKQHTLVPKHILCEQFSSWLDNGSNRQNKTIPVPPEHGQMHLDTQGALTAPQAIAMDCDTDSAVSLDGCCSDQRKVQRPGGNGGLLKYGFTHSKHISKQGSKPTDTCETCRRQPGSVRCQFCERPVCRGCTRRCDTCCETFCQLCSTLNYDMAMERAFCLSCVSNVG